MYAVSVVVSIIHGEDKLELLCYVVVAAVSFPVLVQHELHVCCRDLPVVSCLSNLESDNCGSL